MEEAEKVRKMSYAAVLAALTGAGAVISIPLGPVPITLQTFFVILAGFLLGARWGFISITLYLLLGAAGLPVFSGGAAGAGHLLGPTGGYLISFPFGAAVAGGLAELGDGRGGIERLSLNAVGGSLASGLILIIGATRLMQFFGMSPEAAFAVGIAPFIVTSLPEIALAVGLSESLSRAGVASASEGPHVRGVDERSLYGVALGLGLVLSALIPWAHLSEDVQNEGETTEATAGLAGHFGGGEVTLVDDDALVEITTTAPSLIIYGTVAAFLGTVAIAVALTAARGLEESYAAVGYGVLGATSVGVTVLAYLDVSGWSLEVGHSVGYGVYLPLLMGVGLFALGGHTLRTLREQPSAKAVGV